jgi:hypothetical protein
MSTFLASVLSFQRALRGAFPKSLSSRRWDPRALRHLLDLSQEEFSWERTIHHMYKEYITRRGDRFTVRSFPLLLPWYGTHLSEVFCRLVVKLFSDARLSTRLSFASTPMAPGSLLVAFTISLLHFRPIWNEFTCPSG